MSWSAPVTIEWWGPVEVPERIKRKLTRLVDGLGALLNEYEAHLFDMANRAANGLDFLMPKIELTLPLYEEGCTYKLRMFRLGHTQIFLETVKGDAVGEVFLG